MSANPELMPVAAHQQQAIAIQQPSTQVAQVLNMLERVLMSPDFDIDRAERLWAMQKEVRAEQARADFIAANSAMQGELPSIQKRGQIKNNAGTVQSTYAKWEDVNDAIKPILMRHGFALSFLVEQDGAKIIVTGILSHSGGHRETTHIVLAPDTTGSKNTVQAVGSSISYGKRYTAGALLNLTSHDEDDDGQAAGRAEFSDKAMATYSDFEAEIVSAIDEVELRKVGEGIAAAGLPPRLQTKLRRTWQARMSQLREGAK